VGGRPAFRADYEVGFDDEGRIEALKLDFYFEQVSSARRAFRFLCFPLLLWPSSPALTISDSTIRRCPP